MPRPTSHKVRRLGKGMGKYVNGRFFNVLAWAIVGALIALMAILLITTLLPGP